MEITLSCPDITQVERDAVNAVMQTPKLALGPKMVEFERMVADYVGSRYAVSVNSGTGALHLCLRGMGIGDGDEVITTPFSFIASANCILFERGRPVFVDIDPETWNIDPKRIESAVTDKTRGIVAVDVFGQTADMDPIRAIADKHKLRLLEDSCEALGARYKGRPAGALGDAGFFGFYPNKQVTTGEGGIMVTDDKELAGLAVSMRNQGRDANAGWLAHARLGYNFRLSELNAALGVAQMQRIEQILANRARVAAYYRERLEDEQRASMQKVLPDCEISWFVMVLRLNDDYTREDRDRILTNLREQGIQCSNYFTPIHLQPFYVEEFGYKRGDFPICEALSDRTVALPFHGLLTEEQVDTVCRAFRKLL
jgi:perosamine synthetase